MSTLPKDTIPAAIPNNGEARIIDGHGTARTIRSEVAKRVQALVGMGHQPGLSVVLVGDDPASQIYVRLKDKAAREAGFKVETVRLAANATQAKVLAAVNALNQDASVHGILVQLPLPKGLDADSVIRAIDPAKDVDGLHPENVAALWRGEPGLRPCTPAGCIELCDRYGIELAAKHAVVVGRSQLVGKPLAALLLERNATVTVCHSRTADLAEHCRRADVLFAAVGKAQLVQGDWIKPGATVIDVGINPTDDGKLQGDVDFQAALTVAGAITPVPRGVGPMTIAMLLNNTGRALANSIGVDWLKLGA